MSVDHDYEPESTSQLPTANQPPRNRRRTCMRCGCISAGLVCVLLVAAIFTLRYIVKSRFTPKQWEQVQQFDTKVISLPEDWHRPATLPPVNIVNFHLDLETTVSGLLDRYSDWIDGYPKNKFLLDRLRTNEKLSAADETSLSLFLTDLQPVLNETSRTVHLPAYTSEISSYGTNRFLDRQVLAKYASIAAIDSARKGDVASAMEIASLPLRLVKRPPQSSSITNLISIAVAAITANTYDNLADRTSDTKVLQRGLDIMTELRPVVFPGDYHNWRYGDTLGALCFAAANGYPVDLKPQPLENYYKQASALYMPVYYDWIINHLPADDQRVQAAKARKQQYYRPDLDWEKVFDELSQNDATSQSIDEIIETPAENQTPRPYAPPDYNSTSYKIKSGIYRLFMGNSVYATIYQISLPNLEEQETRTETAMALYDLARLNFARRIQELEASPVAAASKASKSTSELTAYLSPVPDDPFTSVPFLFSPKIKNDYSIGPDKTDNHVDIIYSATNGTISQGDIWME